MRTVPLDTLLLDWSALALRWLHLVAAIAWIGAAFYFMALDRRLRPLSAVAGESWQVHGGGFYRVRAYRPAPPVLPERLARFRWPAYAAWLSGFLLLVLLYHLDARHALADPGAEQVTPGIAVALSLASLVLGYSLYEILCRTPLARSPRLLLLAVFLLLALAAWLHAQAFAPRAAMLHNGALTGTIMVANLAHIVIPGQRRAIAALRAGQAPDPAWSARADLRMLHNDLLVLPTVFAMLVSHHPPAFATAGGWPSFAAVLVLGALIRHAFHRYHRARHAGCMRGAVRPHGTGSDPSL